MKLKPGIEFSICTFNRITFLKECVESLLKQMVPGTTLLTVVDNHSTDGTREWVMQMMQQHPDIRYLHEPKQGLSHARNAGWREALYEWVFYLDDDCLPPDDFVDTALRLTQQDKNFDAFGGPIVARYKEDVPYWMPDGFGNFTMPFNQVTQIDSGYIRGGCFLIKKRILEELGGFNPDLGVKGSVLRYGEEIELQMRMRKAGFRIGYAPSLQISHYVRAEKTRISWILHAEYAKRRDKMLFDPISLPLATLHLCRTILGRVIWTPVHLYHLVTSNSYPVQKAMYDIFKPAAYSAGEWVGVVIHTLKLK